MSCWLCYLMPKIARSCLINSPRKRREEEKEAGKGYPADEFEKRIREAAKRVRPKYTSPRPSRHAEYAFPMNHFYEIFGDTYVKALVVAAINRYKADLKCKEPQGYPLARSSFRSSRTDRRGTSVPDHRQSARVVAMHAGFSPGRSRSQRRCGHGDPRQKVSR